MNEVNNQLWNIYDERNIPPTENDEIIQLDIHLNERKLHLTNYGNIAFVKSITYFLLHFD